MPRVAAAAAPGRSSRWEASEEARVKKESLPGPPVGVGAPLCQDMQGSGHELACIKGCRGQSVT